MLETNKTHDEGCAAFDSEEKEEENRTPVTHPKRKAGGAGRRSLKRAQRRQALRWWRCASGGTSDEDTQSRGDSTVAKRGDVPPIEAENPTAESAGFNKGIDPPNSTYGRRRTGRWLQAKSLRLRSRCDRGFSVFFRLPQSWSGEHQPNLGFNSSPRPHRRTIRPPSPHRNSCF